MKLHVTIHVEEGSLWAEVKELPGCFAIGDTLEELTESLNEGIALSLEKAAPAPKHVPVSAFTFTQTQEFVVTA